MTKWVAAAVITKIVPITSKKRATLITPRRAASLAVVALITGHLLVLPIIAIIPVSEALSVMIQVIYFKATHGKRFFRMAPLHHHYELKGWKETQVVVRFWIITMLLCLIGLSTLKLR